MAHCVRVSSASKRRAPSPAATAESAAEPGPDHPVDRPVDRPVDKPVDNPVDKGEAPDEPVEGATAAGAAGPSDEDEFVKLPSPRRARSPLVSLAVLAVAAVLLARLLPDARYAPGARRGTPPARVRRARAATTPRRDRRPAARASAASRPSARPAFRRGCGW